MDRLIEAIRKETAVGRALVERFQKGDSVAHIALGDGVVSDNNGVTVTVTYQTRSKTGAQHRGQYDALWFELNPTFLFHRGTSPQ